MLAKLQKLKAFVDKYSDDLNAFYSRYLHQSSDMNSRSQYQEVEKYRRRVRELDSIIKKPVEQNAPGSLTDERFATLSKEYESEHRDLIGKIEKLQALLNQKKNSLQNAENFLEAIGKHTEITELSAPLLHELVEKIVVHAAVGVGKARTQDVDIHWRFIGLLPDK